MSSRITRTKESTCPVCKRKLNAHTNPCGQFSPKAGDVSMCLRCGAPLEFTDSQTVVAMRPETRRDMQKNAPLEWGKMIAMQMTLNRIRK